MVYEKKLCIWSGLSIFLQALGSRRQFDHEADSDPGTLLENLNRLAGTGAEDLPHGDTVADYLAAVPHGELEDLPPRMVQRLIRMRVLEYGRLRGRYLVAVDATGIMSFPTRHCPHCLRRTRNGKTTYYHMVLEAKLVTPDGFALSVGSEFIENTDPRASKQDCERAAVGRLMKKLKGSFGRLRICLLLDALHANRTLFAACEGFGWDWIITFKAGSLPTAFDEFHRLKPLAPENVLEHDEAGRYQRLSWINDLEHDRHRFSAFDCLTYNEKQEVQYFAWITSLPADRFRIPELANRGGRTRWKIENEGFNNQKNRGYELEHAYSHDANAGKNYYFLLQIAHIMVQLLLRGRLARAFGTAIRSLKNFFRRMSESLRHQLIPAAAPVAEAARGIQIRLDTS